MPLFQKGRIKLANAGFSDFKIDCDFLSGEDLDTLAYIASKSFDFGEVSGVPTGGLRFANALQMYKNPQSSTLLIVDDVYTTGKSLIDFTADLLKQPWTTKYSRIERLVIFDRSSYSSVNSIFKMKAI